MGAKIRFLGLLKKYQPENEADDEWIVKAGTTVNDIFDVTGINSTEWPFIYTVNGHSVLREYELREGDELIFSTLFLGG